MGNKIVANMVMLGASVSLTEVVSIEAIKRSIVKRFPRATELNVKALELGMDVGMGLLNRFNDSSVR